MRAPPTGLIINAIMSESAPTIPPHKGPKSAAQTNMGINFTDIFIPEPIRKVPYMAKRTDRAISIARIHICLTPPLFSENLTLKREHKSPKRRVSRKIIIPKDKSRSKLKNDDLKVIRSEMSFLKKEEYTCVAKNKNRIERIQALTLLERLKSPVFFPRYKDKAAIRTIFKVVIIISVIKITSLFCRKAVTLVI